MSDRIPAHPQVKGIQKLPRKLAMGLIRAYQWTLSPLLRFFNGGVPNCRFAPTCSCYAHEAFERHGFFQGSWLAFKRILKCHPLHPGGYDPVPSTDKDTPTPCKHPHTQHSRNL